MTNADLIEEFDRVQQRWGLCDSTRRVRRWLLTALADHTDLVTAGHADIERWLDSQRIVPRTRRTYIGTMATFFKWLHTSGVRSDNPVLRIRAPKTQRLLPRPIATGDLRAAISAADPLMRAWLTLAAFQGLRCCEIAGLHADSVNVDRGVILVEHGKGGRERILPLHPATLAALTDYGMPATGPVFGLKTRCRAAAPATVSRYVGRHFRSLGMPWTAHHLRHWFGTEIYKASLDLRTTQELLGHANPNTTAGYARWSPSTGDIILQLIA